MKATFFLNIKTVSEMNQRCHWAARYKRLRQHKDAAYIGTLEALRGKRINCDKITITLPRLGLRKLDSDNMYSSQKGTRDGIAKALGIDDGDERLTWIYRQRKVKRDQCGVEVEITDE
jgi:hypothetical protein